MKIKLADGSHSTLPDNLVPLFDLLAGYREMFGGGAEGAKGAEDVEIDLSGNAELTAMMFMEATAAIYNPTLDSATIAPKVMDALNYLGYKTCAFRLLNPTGGVASDTFVVYCASFNRIALETTTTLSAVQRIVALAYDILSRPSTTSAPGGACSGDEEDAAAILILRSSTLLWERLDAVLDVLAKYPKHALSFDLQEVYHIPRFWRIAANASEIMLRTRASSAVFLDADDAAELRTAMLENAPRIVPRCCDRCICEAFAPENSEELAIWMRGDPSLSQLRVFDFTRKNIDRFLAALRGLTDRSGLVGAAAAIAAIMADDPTAYSAALVKILSPRLERECSLVAVARSKFPAPRISASGLEWLEARFFVGDAARRLEALGTMIALGVSSACIAPGGWVHAALEIGVRPPVDDGVVRSILASEDAGWMAMCRPSDINGNITYVIGNSVAYEAIRRASEPWVMHNRHIIRAKLMDEKAKAGFGTATYRKRNAKKTIHSIVHGSNYLSDADIFRAVSELGTGWLELFRLNFYQPWMNIAIRMIKMGAAWDAAIINKIEHAKHKQRFYNLLA